MNKESLRSAFADTILKKAQSDKEIIVVCSDSRGSGLVTDFANELPSQFVEIGIAEQNAVTVSGGLASIGKKVYTVGPASFYSMRSAEQIKVDLAYSKNNVKIIGISGGISYGALGSTHHSLQDYALMRAIPDLLVLSPSDSNQMKSLVDELLLTTVPAYVRIGREAVPVIYPEDIKIKIGKAIKWFDGKDIGIIASGQMVHRAIEAAELLKKDNISATVLDMFTIKPLDKETIIELAKSCGCILTVEEHSIYGGLGSAVSEVVVENYPVPMKIIGFTDDDIPNGSDTEVFESFGMDANGIVMTAKTLISKR
ncbi:transketolase family protein [Breznakia pachnodae]|uniref:Transketolase n=1 Tax=Breznakia pachnodae TaxID=265178 RepID=A0ABU0E3U0_9FIRM|nr:transketolase C-terminal domain-containing protein [Breznakia pachnodae]MDQ0361470.1 transketolase [Breznakia pachnodae]